jgi:hyaluronate lyase
VHFQSFDRTGSWHDLNANGPTDELEARYQTIWFDHGAKPQGATYAYIELPGKTGAEMRRYQPTVRIVQNDASAQAVQQQGAGLTAVNFWAAAPKPVAGVTADGIAAVVVHEARGVASIAVADPTQANAGVLHVELEQAAGGVVSKDDAITVERTAPTVRLSVNVRESQGKTLRITLQSAR